VRAENAAFVKGVCGGFVVLVCCDADILKTIWSCCCFNDAGGEDV